MGPDASHLDDELVLHFNVYSPTILDIKLLVCGACNGAFYKRNANLKFSFVMTKKLTIHLRGHRKFCQNEFD
jgi:hypothetical protein